MAAGQLRRRSCSRACWRYASGSLRSGTTSGVEELEGGTGGDAHGTSGDKEARRAVRSHAVRHEATGCIAVDPPTAERNGKDQGAPTGRVQDRDDRVVV